MPYLPSASVPPASLPGARHNPILAACWSLPAWQTIPYRSVEVFLPRGSSFLLCGPDLAYVAARRLQLPGIALLTHIEEQVLPMLAHAPEMLLDIAARLPSAEARELARGAFWQSFQDACLSDFPRTATLTLSSKRWS